MELVKKFVFSVWINMEQKSPHSLELLAGRQRHRISTPQPHHGPTHSPLSPAAGDQEGFFPFAEYAIGASTDLAHTSGLGGPSQHQEHNSKSLVIMAK